MITMTPEQREKFELRNYALNRINEAPLSWCHFRYLHPKLYTANMGQDNPDWGRWIVRALHSLLTE